jgi:protoporphyrin/coproporphyrin ferrochelatase
MKLASRPLGRGILKTSAARYDGRQEVTMGTYRSPPAERRGTGVLLMNLGTPERADYGPIRRFLAAFLADRRVVEASPALWYPILFGPVLALRPLKTRRLYRQIWLPEGSPLTVYSRRLAAVLAARLAMPVDLAMNYGEPTLSDALERLARVERLVVLPLYPQYSGSTTGAAFDALARALASFRVVPALDFVAGYHDEPLYIEALAARVREAWREGESHLVCSFHGLPREYDAAGDPYRVQAERTTALLAAKLGLGPKQHSLSYQSRFGPKRWLEPATEAHLVALAASGTKAVTVVTPAFAVDCLETLEELAIRARERYLAAGGERFTLVPALNDSDGHVALLESLVRRRLPA